MRLGIPPANELFAYMLEGDSHVLDGEASSAFVAALHAPVSPNDRSKKRSASPPPWAR